MSKTKYIFSTGELKRRENSISFRNSDGQLTHMPIENIRELYIMNEVALNTKLLQFLSAVGITVHFFDYFGHYIGTYYPKEYLLSGRLKVQQALVYSDQRRLLIAKEIVSKIALNLNELMYHYFRHGKTDVKHFLDFCMGVNEWIDKAGDIKQILMIEGKIWAMFYDMFGYVLKEEFILSKRVRRPPDNPINALISFGNSMLYSKTVTMLYHTHLDQTISFLHEPSESRFSLSLDISEVFKPALVFRTIFELVNTSKLKVERHFDKKLNYCLLNETGKKIFLQSFEERIKKGFKHSRLGRNVSYETAIKLEAYKLSKYLLEGKPYIAYSTKSKS